MNNDNAGNDDPDILAAPPSTNNAQDKHFKPVARFLASVSRSVIQSSHTIIHYSLFNLGARHLIQLIHDNPFVVPDPIFPSFTALAPTFVVGCIPRERFL